MSQQSGSAKRSEKGLLTPDNCVVTLIDLQPQMLFGVSNFDRQAIINNNVALAKAARVFDLPVVLSTVESKGFSGNMWPQVQAVFPKQAPIERTSSTLRVLHTPVTSAPSAAAIWTAYVPTPPPAPLTSTR